MAGVILENISTKKLIAICLFLFSLSLACFIMGGVKVPDAVHTQVASGNWCKRNLSATWHPARGPGSCRKLTGHDDPRILQERIVASDIMFSFQYPLPRDNNPDLKMSRWFMYHIAVLTFDIEYEKDYEMGENPLVSLDVLVGYKDDAASSDWTKLLNDTVYRQLNCRKPEREGHRYDCEVMDFFEIGNMHHERYLVNIRLPPNSETGHNMELGKLENIDLIWFAQTGGFTLYYLVMKTVYFALVLPLTIWNWKRVADLNRSPVLLEKLLLFLACATVILNFPVDWLVLVIKMPFMLLWSDIRQGIFLSVLLAYWLIFIGEHMVDDVQRGTLTSYWKQLASVILASSLMFIFDLCERGMRMANPFFSLWSTKSGAILGQAFIGIAIAAAVIYVIILTICVFKAIYHIWKKRSAFSRMAKNQSIHYKSIIYRFFFSLIYTAVCGLLTVVSFAMGQIYESRWKWDLDSEDLDDEENKFGDSFDAFNDFQINTAFQLGVYGLWNVYVISMLIFYAPSHKRTGRSTAPDELSEEHVELNSLPSTSQTNGASTHLSNEDVSDETTTLTSSHKSSTRDEQFSQIHTLANKTAIS